MGRDEADEDCCATADEPSPSTTVCPSCGTVGRVVHAHVKLADVQPILVGEARVRVAVKETTPPTTICYCFDVSAEDLRREVAALGREIDAVVKLATAPAKKDCCG